MLIGRGSGVALGHAIQIDSLDSGTTQVKNNNITNVIATDYLYGVRDRTGDAGYNNDFSHIDLSENIGTTVTLVTDSDNRVYDIIGYTPAGSVTPPSVPATGVAATNTYPHDVQVYVNDMVSGGNVTLNGTGVDSTNAPNDGNGMYILHPGDEIALFYASGSPTWVWFGMR